MNKKETDLVVSILNFMAERLDWDIDEEGFGYDPKTLEISNPNGLEESLKDLWGQLRTSNIIIP